MNENDFKVDVSLNDNAKRVALYGAITIICVAFVSLIKKFLKK